MNDAFVNRLAMFQTCLGTLNDPQHREVWFGQAPAIFTTKVQQLAQAVTELEEFARQREADITGTTQDKQREERELSEAAHLVGSTLAIWYRNHRNEASAAKIDLTPASWRALRDQQLLEKTRLTRDLAQSLIDGPQSDEAADYGITADLVARLSQEIDDFAALISAPQQRIAERKVRTSQLPERFQAVQDQLEELDVLILHFADAAGGDKLIADYQSSRLIRQYGVRRSRDEEAIATASV